MAEESMQIDYEVSVSGLEQTQTALQSAKRNADQAKDAIENTKRSSVTFYPILFNVVGAVNNVRQAVNQLLEGIETMNPLLLLSAFLNMVQVVNNLTTLMTALKTSTASAAAAQGILATLTGNWWLIPLAITAGALIYSQIRSMQEGGLVTYTGLHYLHKGETVVPANRYNFGNIFVSFNDQPKPGQERDKWLENLEDKLAKRTRRAG